MSNIIPFQFENLSVRVLDLDGNHWFVAADVCSALTIKNPRDAISKLDDDDVQSVNFATVANSDGVINQTLNANQKINIINESGLYSLILTSRKAEAKKFKKWVTSEVLPSIRKTGSYSANPHQNDFFSVSQIKAARAMFDTYSDIGLKMGADASLSNAVAVAKVMQHTGLDLSDLLPDSPVYKASSDVIKKQKDRDDLEVKLEQAFDLSVTKGESFFTFNDICRFLGLPYSRRLAVAIGRILKRNGFKLLTHREKGFYLTPVF